VNGSHRVLGHPAEPWLNRGSGLRMSVAVLCLGLLTACRPDMFNQPKSKPLAGSDFFPDHAPSRALPPHTVARGQLQEDTVYFTGRIGTNLVETLPLPVTRALLERGQARFNIYCAVCHGLTGEGNGIVVQRGFPPPPSYHIDRLRAAPVGHFYDVMTRGYGIMFSYAARVEPADRWAIAGYIRALQLSRHATLAEAPAAEAARLQTENP
jgi:mono/diheme cytochrome c family protein